VILLDVDAGSLPKIELGDVRAGAIAARDERRALVLDGLERRDDILAAADAGEIALSADQDEVVVHHRVALYAESIGEKFFFSALGVDKHGIGVPATPDIKGLAGALGDHLHINTGLGLDQRQYVSEQARVFRRSRRGDNN
jgi:hypothetical protein